MVVVVVVASRAGNLVCSGGTLVSSCRRRLVDGATTISVSEFATLSHFYRPIDRNRKKVKTRLRRKTKRRNN